MTGKLTKDSVSVAYSKYDRRRSAPHYKFLIKRLRRERNRLRPNRRWTHVFIGFYSAWYICIYNTLHTTDFDRLTDHSVCPAVGAYRRLSVAVDTPNLPRWRPWPRIPSKVESAPSLQTNISLLSSFHPDNAVQWYTQRTFCMRFNRFDSSVYSTSITALFYSDPVILNHIFLVPV